LVNWSYVVVCKKCGYISAEKLPEKEAKVLMHDHSSKNPDCTIGHISLMKVRT
jgi:transcription initiation factor TFIIIB Brf1 subunit/transcription initiation factor TFIIB